jgi:hypothetical protein
MNGCSTATKPTNGRSLDRGSIPLHSTALVSNLGRLAYQRGQLSVKQPLNALQVQLLLDLPTGLICQIMESNPIGRSALFAKQMELITCGSSPLLSAFENVV